MKPAKTHPAASDAEGKGANKGRWKLLIRAAIYIPLLAYFTWQAGAHMLMGREAADAAFRASVNQWLEHPPRTINVDGQEVPILEVTEAEAIELGYLPKLEATSETSAER